MHNVHKFNTLTYAMLMQTVLIKPIIKEWSMTEQVSLAVIGKARWLPIECDTIHWAEYHSAECC